MSSASVSLADSAPRSVARPRVLAPLTAILVVAFVLRVVLVLSTPHYVPLTDAKDYDRTAVSLALTQHFPASTLAPGGGPTAYRPPLFPGLLAGVYRVVGAGSQMSRWEAGRLLEAALGTLIVALTFLIAARVWDRRVALLSAGVAAVFPPLVLVGSSLMTEPLFICLVLGAVLAALIHRGSERSWRWTLTSGVLAGLAALTRGNGIVVAIPLAFLVWTERPRLSRSALRAPIALLAAAVAVLIPWTVRNASVLHAVVPISTESGYATAGTYNDVSAHFNEYPALWITPLTDMARILAQHPGLNEAQLSDELNQRAIDYVGGHPGYVPKVLYWNTLRTLDLTGTSFERWAARFESYPPWLASLSVYSFWVLGVAVLLGLALGAWRVAPPALWACPATLVLVTVFFLGSTRYRSPADPFMIMLAAGGVLAAWRAARGRRSVPSRAG